MRTHIFPLFPNFFLFPLLPLLFLISCHSPHDNDNHPPQDAVIPDSLFTRSLEYATSNKSLSRRYTKDLFRFAQKEKNKKWEGNAYLGMSATCFYESQLDSVIYYSQKALSIFEDIKDTERVMITKMAIAQCMSSLFRYDEALKIFQECLDFYAGAGKPIENKAKIFINIASLYGDMQLFDLSNDYYEQALNIFKVMDEDVSILHDMGTCYTNMGENLFQQKEYQKSLEYQGKALEIYRKINDTYFTGYALRGLVDCYLALDQDEEAQKALNEFSKIAKSLDNSFFLFLASKAKANYYYKRQQYQKALVSGREALSYINDIDKRNLAVIYETLSLASIHAGTPHETVGYIEKLTQLSQEAFNEEWSDKMTEMEVKYETEKKELKISALEEEKRLMTWLSIFGGALLLMGLAALFFLWRWTVQKRRISEHQRELAESRIRQLEQEKQLTTSQALLDGETQERTRLARDLHDGLGGILAGAKLNLQELKKGAQMDAATVQRYETALSLLDESVREMRRVAHHLMPESLAVSGLKQATADFCNSIPHVTFYHYGADMRFDPKKEVLLYRIMHELVTNALKHSNSSQIMVQIVNDSGRIALTVQDDGCGFDPSTPSRGIGLSNIRTRVAACNGTLLLDSKPGIGTEVNVEIIF